MQFRKDIENRRAACACAVRGSTDEVCFRSSGFPTSARHFFVGMLRRVGAACSYVVGRVSGAAESLNCMDRVKNFSVVAIVLLAVFGLARAQSPESTSGFSVL